MGSYAMILRLILPLVFFLNCQIIAKADRVDEVPQDFIGFLDVSDRYGGYEEWIKAAWGNEDDAQTYTISTAVKPIADILNPDQKPISAKSFSTLEIGYEEPTILVYRRYSDWAQVRVNEDYIWIKMEGGDRFARYENEIDGNRLAYLLSNSVSLAKSPGGVSRTITIKPEMQGVTTKKLEFYQPHIKVIGRAVFHNFEAEYNETLNDRYGTSEPGQAWFKIRVPNNTACQSAELAENKPLAVGWIPAKNDNGEITVWFSSRGC